MVTIIVALLVFGVIIAIHEFGHFIVAKLCGIRVNKFAIGMGPCVLKKQWGETEYSLRLFPVGGFCAMEGEDAESDDPRAFAKKSVPKRMAVVVAGAVMNLILGFFLIMTTTLLYGDIITLKIAGFHEAENKVTGEMVSVSTSEGCGLKVGDRFISMDGMRLFTDTDLSYKLQNASGEPMKVVVERDGERVTLEKVIFLNTQTEGALDFYVEAEKCSFLNVIRYSAMNTVSTARLIWISVKDLLTGKYGFRDLSGPVGIIGTIGEVATAGETFKENLTGVLSLASFITVNVGIFNLLPLPALDGGRLIFLIVEAIRRKPINPEHEGIVHLVGMAILFLLMIAVTFQDILRLFNGG